MSLSDGALRGLRSAVIEPHKKGFAVIIMEQVSPKAYGEIKKALQVKGGTYTTGGKIVFLHDPKDDLAAVLESGESNPTDYFPTPDDIIDRMLNWYIDWSWLPKKLRILEPSAGKGALLERILKNMHEHGIGGYVDAVEILPLHCRALWRIAEREKNIAVVVHEADFLTWTPRIVNPTYDLIAMNPPFRGPDDKDAYIAHIQRAYNLLAPGGKLVAVTPNGWTFNDREKRKVEFSDFVTAHGTWFELPLAKYGTTQLRTTMVLLESLEYPEDEEETAPVVVAPAPVNTVPPTPGATYQQIGLFGGLL